jgi:hypothetical protein
MEVDIVNMSLLEFCNRAKGLLNASQSDFVQFVLTGRRGGRQAYVDPILNRLTDDEELNVIRDYDSLLGIDRHLCVQRYITVYPVARKEDTLTRNLHIQYEFHTSRVRISFFFFKKSVTHLLMSISGFIHGTGSQNT